MLNAVLHIISGACDTVRMAEPEVTLLVRAVPG